MAYNTIKIKKYSDNVEEMKASAAITPGMLVEIYNSGGTPLVRKHSKDDGWVGPIKFALEDELQGKGIADDYAADDMVQIWTPYRGDWVYALLADGENVSIGDKLTSNGDGFLQKFGAEESAIEESASIVAVAREAINRSTSSGADTNKTGRILVEIV